MTAELIFEDPPIDGRRVGRKGEIAEWLAALRDHPGVWAKYHRKVSPGTAAHVRAGKKAGTKPGEFEVRTVNAIEGTRVAVIMYVRYVGANQ